MEKNHRLFAGSCDFVAGVATLDRLPDFDLPEVAFAGRSNVGKSSLINALTGRKALARTSHTPGRTQQLNFFNIGGVFHLVDMPGYGYAKVSKKQREAWNRVMRSYLRGRPVLRCVFILVDSRHGLKDSDEEMMAMLDECAVPYRIVLTKEDKSRASEKEQSITSVKSALKKHPAAWPEPLLTSAETKYGVQELQEVIMSVIA